MEPYNRNFENKETKTTKANISGRVMGGLVVLAVGVIIMSYQVGMDVPKWLMSWPSLLIVIGIYIGARHGFRNWGWIVPVIVGSAFLADRIFWEINIKPFIWPAVIIGVGLFMIFKPRAKGNDFDWSGFNFDQKSVSPEDEVIDSVNIFGHTKKTILSKTFRGGDVMNFFGGCELNLTQADIQGPVMMEMTQIFGGAKIIVPSTWKIQSELISIFGGVDDKRMIQPNVDATKVLVLKGTCIFGGLEIKSY